MELNMFDDMKEAKFENNAPLLCINGNLRYWLRSNDTACKWGIHMCLRINGRVEHYIIVSCSSVFFRKLKIFNSTFIHIKAVTCQLTMHWFIHFASPYFVWYSYHEIALAKMITVKFPFSQQDNLTYWKSIIWKFLWSNQTSTILPSLRLAIS